MWKNWWLGCSGCSFAGLLCFWHVCGRAGSPGDNATCRLETWSLSSLSLCGTDTDNVHLYQWWLGQVTWPGWWFMCFALLQGLLLMAVSFLVVWHVDMCGLSFFWLCLGTMLWHELFKLCAKIRGSKWNIQVEGKHPAEALKSSKKTPLKKLTTWSDFCSFAQSIRILRQSRGIFGAFLPKRGCDWTSTDKSLTFSGTWLSTSGELQI